MVLLGTYFILFLRGLDTAAKAKDQVGRLMAIGITAMFFVYFIVNIGMTLGHNACRWDTASLCQLWRDFSAQQLHSRRNSDKHQDEAI